MQSSSLATQRAWTIPARIDRVGPLVLEAAEFLTDRGVGDGPLFRAQLLLEEIVSNVVRHAFEDQPDRSLRVRVGLAAGEIQLTVVDEAPPFDLLHEAPEPDLWSELEERRPGGLGIFLVKQLADDVDYRRSGNENQVHMRVQLASGAA